MAKMRPPSVPEVSVPVVGDDDLKRLLKAAEGTTFDGRRDTAILRLFIECGLRLGEVAGLQVHDIDWEPEVVTVMGKGSRPAPIPFGPKTAQALARYVRVRGGHKQSRLDDLWLGPQGALTSNGIAQVLRRRCAQSGIERLHPHQLRHTAAHVAAKSGLGDSDMMESLDGGHVRCSTVMGPAPPMSAPGQFRRLSPGDRL